MSPVATRLRWRPFRLRLGERFRTASSALSERRGVLVELVDRDGNRGIGEASPMPEVDGGTQEAVLDLLAGRAAELIAKGVGPSGPGVAALRCALDVATLDLEATASGQRLASLVGGSPVPSVLVNAVIGAGSPEWVAEEGAAATASGYEAVKLKVGTGPLASDLERVSALREVCPNAAIRLDANGGWDERTAERALALLARYDIELVEQPVPAGQVDAMARLRLRSAVPIAADESLIEPGGLERVLRLGAADCLILKPMFLGGIRPALVAARDAEAQGIDALATTSFDSSVGIAAALQLASLLPTARAHGLATGEHLESDVVARTLRPRHGRIATTDVPGLGLSPEPDALDAVATGPWQEVTCRE